MLPLPLLLRLLRSCSSQVARPQRCSLARKVRQAAAHRFELLDHQVLQEVTIQPALLLLLLLELGGADGTAAAVAVGCRWSSLQAAADNAESREAGHMSCLQEKVQEVRDRRHTAMQASKMHLLLQECLYAVLQE
jgi:hypothetical protein